MLSVVRMILGPVQTNTYLLSDPQTGSVAVIDPAWDGDAIRLEAEKRNWRISSIWFTHAHFDHIAGAGALADGLNPPPQVALHPLDHGLWQVRGAAALFGLAVDPGPEPNIDLYHGQILRLGDTLLEVRHAPGHTPGHVIFYCASDKVAFVGDVIFQGSIGRTDLPGGNYDTLIESIRTQVLTLPDDTRLLAGHEGETTVGRERRYNPFLS